MNYRFIAVFFFMVSAPTCRAMEPFEFLLPHDSTHNKSVNDYKFVRCTHDVKPFSAKIIAIAAHEQDPRAYTLLGKELEHFAYVSNKKPLSNGYCVLMLEKANTKRNKQTIVWNDATLKGNKYLFIREATVEEKKNIRSALLVTWATFHAPQKYRNDIGKALNEHSL